MAGGVNTLRGLGALAMYVLGIILGMTAGEGWVAEEEESDL